MRNSPISPTAKAIGSKLSHIKLEVSDMTALFRTVIGYQFLNKSQLDERCIIWYTKVSYSFLW